ncbi:MAG: efflux RND transporter permease subunit [Acidobacteriota bacterium]|nr:efflux RND transporter permease subunit [Acidobacteriota bacterium]
MKERNIAGRIASLFIESKLTLLLILAAVAIGGLSLSEIPREEEPQITVPMIDLFTAMPGASAKEVEQRISTPLERTLRNNSGVEYTYSTSQPGLSLVTLRFRVGEKEDDAIVQTYKQIEGYTQDLPVGASHPLLKVRSINDVPMMTLTLTGNGYSVVQLRQIADELDQQIKRVDDVAQTVVIGGQPRRINLWLDTAKLASYGMTPELLASRLQAANVQTTPAPFAQGGQEATLQVASFFASVDDLAHTAVGIHNNLPVYLHDVARLQDGGSDVTNYVLSGQGIAQGRGAELPAVTIAISKRAGTNATTISDHIKQRIAALRGSLLPPNLNVSITRDYGDTAKQKADELLLHLFLATLSVTLLIALALGWREGGVVLVAIPVTLALTIALFYFYGYTVNRITLFALIFSIGILVDDAIVVVENIVRHFRMGDNAGRSFREVAIDAVDEVGNPTILATFAVIAAILPMAFVRGLMGPYMRPIPIGASSAMLLSLVVAFTVTPWAALKFLRSRASSHHEETEGKLTLRYRHLMGSLLDHKRNALLFLVGVVGLLLLAVALVPLKAVKVKMLPFDNKSEFQVILNMPEGTSLEQTTAVAQQMGQKIAADPDVTDFQIYSGTAAPFNFNGLVRHYYLRGAANQADIQVNLKPRKERKAQSHDIAKRLRPVLKQIADAAGARIAVAEVPPGPPVQQTLVAEIYGPDEQKQRQLAAQVKSIFEHTDGVVDTDWFVAAPQVQYDLHVDSARAAMAGLSPQQIAANVSDAVQGADIGLMHDSRSREVVPIHMQAERSLRASSADISNLQLVAANGSPVSLSSLGTLTTSTIEQPIQHKNLLPVVYVVGDVSGAAESPVYVILKMKEEIAKLSAPDGLSITQYSTQLPDDTQHYSLKWDGEWQITYEVFRDLGLAFAVVLVLIYILVVGWFRSFLTPLVIMAPIPLTLVGILPGHAMLGAFFTATSMIGFIAGAGIIVRNSIILVDFIEVRRRDGLSLRDAVIDAGAVRFRPMLLTAGAVVLGSSVILTDPIFQGLAISLMAGEVASTLLSRLAIPVLYFYTDRWRGPSVAAAPAAGDATEMNHG